MKMINSLKTVAAVAALFTAVVANAEPKAKVYVNSYMKPNYAVVSVVPQQTNDAITKMEVTDETGNIVYVTKRIANVKSAQYLLDIAKLSDGVYNVNFTFSDMTEVSKVFVVEGNTVVK